MSMTAQSPDGTRWWLVLPDDPTKPLISVKNPILRDSYLDAPCVFSTTRASAWQFDVSNQGQFFTVPAPLSRAQFDYVEFLGRDGVSRLLRVDNLGQMVSTC